MLKRFIDDQGTFEIEVPITWKYSFKDGKVHTFQEYEIWKSDSFQLSINPFKDQSHKDSFVFETLQLHPVDIGEITYFSYPDHADREFTVKAWTVLMSGKRILFTYTHPNSVDPDLDNRSVEVKKGIVLECIRAFRLIDETERKSKLNSYRFGLFLQGVGATALLTNKAIENKAFIEGTCLFASQIDALLRIGIVLKNQIINGNSEIELEWIYQGLADKKKSEKDVYTKAKDRGVIGQVLFDELYALYEDRNRVIHRFIISEITYAEIEEISYKYYKMRESINSIIYDIEAEQIHLNVGMTKKGEGDSTVDHLDYIKGKIGKQDYFENKE